MDFIFIYDLYKIESEILNFSTFFEFLLDVMHIFF